MDTPPTPEPSPSPPCSMGIFTDLRDRRILRFLVAYAAAAWVMLQVVDQFVGNGLIPPIAYAATLTLTLFAAPGALIVAWFHGAKGRQDVPREEVWMLLVVGVVAVGATTAVALGGADRSGTSPGLAGVQDPRNVAVLYFEPRGGGDAEFLAAGLTEALIDQLGGVEGLRVISRSGVQPFRGREVEPPDVAAALEAGTLVSGTVAQAGDRIRVEVQAVYGESGVQFGSTRLERPRTEVFELQDELADSVAEFLRRQIGVAFGDRSLQAATRSVEAWEGVQQAAALAYEAEALFAEGDAAGAERILAEADDFLARAEEEDPDWIEPVNRRGWLAYRHSRLGGLDRDHYERWINVGMGHADRALARAPGNADALELAATLEYWRYLLSLVPSHEVDALLHRVEDRFSRAVQVDPSRASAHTSLSHLHLNAGRFAQAKLSAERAYRADPFLENANLTLWRLYQASWNLGDAVEARRACDEGQRRFHGDFRFVQCQLMSMGFPGSAPDVQRAWALADTFTTWSPPQVRDVNRLRGQMYVAMALVRAGLADSARAVASRSRSDPFQDPLREIPFMESIVLGWVGEADEAVEQLESYLAASPGELETYRRQASRGGLPWYHVDLLEEPAFRSLVGIR